MDVDVDACRSIPNGFSPPDEARKNPPRPTIRNVRDDDELSNDEQEKQLEDELDDIDVVQATQAELSAAPGAAEIVPQTSVSRKRLNFLSKLPYVSF